MVETSQEKEVRVLQWRKIQDVPELEGTEIGEEVETEEVAFKPEKTKAWKTGLC